MKRVVVIALLVACSKSKPLAIENKRAPADAAAATEADCDQLLTHLVDLEFAREPSAGTADAIATQKRDVVAAKRDEFRGACMTTPRERVMCALAAPNLDAVAKCDENR
ncbi:MAG TPA: hypothetical protein VIV40_42230 [Kofleriaceae bacterium]